MPLISLEEFIAANDPLREAQARNVQVLDNGRVLIPFSALGARQREPERGLVGSAFARGVKTVQSDFTAAAGLVSQGLGFDEVAQGFYNRAAELSQETAGIERRVGRVEDIKSALDVGIFALETLIENAPLLASIAIPGLTAAKLVGLAGRKAVRAGATTAAQLAKKKKLSGTFAAFLSDVGLQTGESVGIATEAGVDPLSLRVVGSGLGKGALDFVPILALAKKLGLTKGLPFGEVLERHIAGGLVEKGFIRRAAGNVGTLIAYEVPTEVSQEIINISLDRSFSQFEGEFTAEEKSQLLNAAAGAAAFGLLGIPAGIVKPQGALRPASDEDLRAANVAATPVKLLPAPGLRVTPEGVVLPVGVTEAPYLPELDTPVTGTTVAQGVAQALGRDQRPDLPNTFLLTPEGVDFPHVSDTHTAAADEIRGIPEFQRTPTEQAIVVIDDARAATIITDTHEIPVPDEAQQRLPAVIQTLVQMRDDTFLDPGFRRKSDGVLTKAGERRIATIDKRIAALSERLGIPNPLQQVITQEISDAEEQLLAFNADQDTQRSERPDSRLTTQESALLDKLEETTGERPLTFEEEDIRNELIEKREGTEEEGGQKLTPEEVKQLGTKSALEEKEVDVQRREGGEVEGGLTVARVTEIVQEVTKKLIRGPEYVIALTGDTRAFPKDSQRKRDLAGSARGAFFLDEPNRVYIFADRHSNTRDVVETVLHETLAHHGLRAFLSREDLDTLLTTIYRTRGQEIQDRFGVPTSQQEALRFAEEFIAEVAENGLDQSFLARIIATIRRVLRRVAPNMKFTDNDITFMLRDVSRFLSGRIPSRNRGGIIEHMSNDAFMRAAGTDVMDAVLPQMESLAKVWGTKLLTKVLTPLQLSEKFPIPGVQEYIEFVQLWAARKGVLVKNPGDIANRWQRMPRQEGQILAQAVLEASELSDKFGRALTLEEEIALMKKLSASKHVYEMFTEIKGSFKTVLELLQTGLEKAAIREAVKGFANPKAEAERLLQLWERDKTKAGHKAFLDGIAENKDLAHFRLGAKLLSIDKDMSILRDRTYFPRVRFGQYAIIVRAVKDITYNGKNYKGPRKSKDGRDLLGEVVNYETFENVGARTQRRPSLGTQFKDQGRYVISEGFVSDEEFSFLGMPPALFEALKENLELSPSQIEALKELYFRYSPGKAFLRHLTQRKGVDGYNTDAMRVYASYMMNAANHIARIEFSEDMGIQQKVMREAVRGSQQELRQATTAGIVQDYFNKHFRYIMNPENDLAALRAWGFLFYLGFNVKSAAVNLTQVPMVAYPFLASVYGDGAATAALLRAYGTVTQWRRGKLVLDNATDTHLRRAIAEQIVDESLATELAGIGESDVLQRLMPQDASVRLTNEVAFYGSFIFKHAEKYNREVVFIAARELALQRNPHDQEAAYRAARKAVQATMFEYKKWNRPAFMRGKKSVLFLFWQYMQHLSFMAYGGEGKGPALRVWGMLLFAAGLQGLPFMENFFDIIDFAGTQAKEGLGMKDPKVALRDDIRALAREITDHPDAIMHGWSRYLGLGPLHLLNLLGAPIPNVDISGSLSAGRVIPGTEALFGHERDPAAKFGRTMAEVLGPVVGVGYNIWKALESSDPDTWKVWERALPTALQGVSKAVRRQTRGEETFRGGGTVVSFDPFDQNSFAENVAQTFGFATTRVNQRFELRHSQEELKRYWIARRSAVMENYAWAILSEDKEGLELAVKKLKQFNAEAPAGGLKISGTNIRQSIRERFRRGHLREIGVPSETAFRGLFRELEEANPEGAPER